jgi:hypothetical protein
LNRSSALASSGVNAAIAASWMREESFLQRFKSGAMFASPGCLPRIWIER